MKCPVCKSLNTGRHIEIASAELSVSLIYGDIIIMVCRDCGHVFNDISAWPTIGYYYIHDYVRHKFTPSVVDNNFMGGGGVESIVVTQDDNDKYVAELINLNAAPCANDKQFDFIALDQFLEHCWNIDNVMRNLRRLTRRGGVVYVSVPDYARYNTRRFLFIKEHIHHFTGDNLKMLFLEHGFECIKGNSTSIPIIGGSLHMPVIEFLFENKKPDAWDGIYYYGASRELLYVLENTDQRPIAEAIIDDTPAKQGRHVNGIPIIDSAIINTLSDKATIIISAVSWRGKLEKKIRDMGFTGNIEYMDMGDV